ncbi:unnamed protein product [Vitrella brassicaformis CCMP3155]|uniref:Uncharacterized protein n=1 Tax=Vitrella brassicaformis (strain CCMP3155) TaxID=1169540 RepID=A0A0G4FWK9_VITBC|nr:unnamed protein product [Vitrella brassicaformis CCMP3155]|eukprot:CEM19524.1 unnamed protein product [Vitrella brassicaformis CCMP3155]
MLLRLELSKKRGVDFLCASWRSIPWPPPRAHLVVGNTYDDLVGRWLAWGLDDAIPGGSGSASGGTRGFWCVRFGRTRGEARFKVNACCLKFIRKRCDDNFQSERCLAIREYDRSRPVRELFYFGTGKSLKAARQNAKMACFMDPSIRFLTTCRRSYTLVFNICPRRRLLQDIISPQNNSSMAPTSQRSGEPVPLLFTGFIVNGGNGVVDALDTVFASPDTKGTGMKVAYDLAKEWGPDFGPPKGFQPMEKNLGLLPGLSGEDGGGRQEKDGPITNHTAGGQGAHQ